MEWSGSGAWVCRIGAMSIAADVKERVEASHVMAHIAGPAFEDLGPDVG